jgi:hypothetical protein
MVAVGRSNGEKRFCWCNSFTLLIHMHFTFTLNSAACDLLSPANNKRVWTIAAYHDDSTAERYLTEALAKHIMHHGIGRKLLIIIEDN